MHWNGVQWTRVPTAWVGELSGVAAVSPTNVWAVGYYYGQSSYQPMIQHWDGTQWSLAWNPQIPGRLDGLAALSASDIWAVGSSNGSLAARWNGTQWNVVSTP